MLQFLPGNAKIASAIYNVPGSCMESTAHFMQKLISAMDTQVIVKYNVLHIIQSICCIC